MAATRKGKMVDESPLEETAEAPEEELEEELDLGEEEEEGEEEYDSRNMDPNEELWEGGPTFAHINAWKDEFGDIYVTSVTPEKHVVWRTLNRFEYRRLIKNLEQAVSTGQVSQAEANLNNEESIAEMCILYPPYSRQTSVGEMAGVASTISQQVMEASAFTAIEVRQL